MKIRGTTVGTPIKPERVLSKPVTLSEEQKAQARENIGACEINDDQVRMDKTWSSAQISAELADVYAEFDTCVRHFPQEKTDEEKAQARKNIGAIGDGDYVTELTADFLGVADSDDPSAPGSKRGAYMRYLGCREEDGTDNIMWIGTEGETGDVAISGVAHGIKDTDAVNVKQLKDAEVRMVDKLCPSFTETGALVTCQPVEGYPLTVTAEQGTTITRFGKNLVDTDVLLNKYLTKDENGIYHFDGTVASGSGVIGFNPPIPANTPIHFKFHDFGGYNANSDALLTTSVSFADGTSEGGNWFGVSQNFTNELTLKKKKAVTALQFYKYQPSEDFRCQFSALQAEIGETATAYEPYQSPVTYTADETGKVTGITGSGEVMNLLADSGIVTVSGKANPAAEIEKLKNAILAMGANV